MFDNRKYYQNQPKPPTFEQLYPDFTAEEQDEAGETVRRYVQLVWRIYQRLKSEKNGKI
jgi:hypothetical protein